MAAVPDEKQSLGEGLLVTFLRDKNLLVLEKFDDNDPNRGRFADCRLTMTMNQVIALMMFIETTPEGEPEEEESDG